jgi:hypothetical protein
VLTAMVGCNQPPRYVYVASHLRNHMTSELATAHVHTITRTVQQFIIGCSTRVGLLSAATQVHTTKHN